MAFCVFVMGICYVVLTSTNDHQFNYLILNVIFYSFFCGAFSILTVANLFIGIHLLVAMKQHQNYEYRSHKRRIVTEILVATFNMAMIVGGSLNSMFYYACYRFSNIYNYDSSTQGGICGRIYSTPFIEQMKSQKTVQVYLVLFFVSPIVYVLPIVY